MSAYYNEPEPFKAAWLRELMKAGAITEGEVDERSIVDVRADDIRGFDRCHFFAGIGVWDYALNLAGWEGPVWTGSCPCPSFSAAGKGRGFDDPRHLWPEWFRLIRERRPAAVFGEQVAAAIGHGWLDLVQSDLEAEAYAVGKMVLGACSVGAPHIRQRLYFVGVSADSHKRGSQIGWSASDGRMGSSLGRGADAEGVCAALAESGRGACASSHPDGRQSSDGDVQRSGEQRLLAADCGTGERPDCADLFYPGYLCPAHRVSTDTASPRCDGAVGEPEGDPRNEARMRVFGADGEPERSANTMRDRTRHGPGESLGAQTATDQGNRGLSGQRLRLGKQGTAGASDDTLSPRLEGHFGDVREWRGPGWLAPLTARSVAEAGATRGFWADCDWWYGSDGKYRPAGPGIQPLAHGAVGRVGRLRGYGDAIVAPAAAAFIEAAKEAMSA